jgi:hypothetical protein
MGVLLIFIHNLSSYRQTSAARLEDKSKIIYTIEFNETSLHKETDG